MIQNLINKKNPDTSGFFNYYLKPKLLFLCVLSQQCYCLFTLQNTPFHFARKKQRKGEHILNISCYNVYNHKNPYLVYVDGTNLMGVSLFPIIPSISYTFKF